MKTLFHENQPRVRAIIRKMTGSYNEDIEQEVYIKAWENSQNYQEKGKLSAWIATITVNVCRDYFRTKQFKATLNRISADNLDEIADKQLIQDEIVDVRLRQKLILKAVDSLPSKMRDVIVFYEFEEMNYDEIAQRLNISNGTVKSRLFNARLILSQKLAYLKGER